LLTDYLTGFRKPRDGEGFARLQRAVEGIPAGGEGQVWVRLPINLGDVVMALPSVFAIKHIWEAWAAPRGVRLRFTLMGKRPVSLFQEAVPGVFAAAHVDEDFPPSRSPLTLMRHWGAHKPLAVINYGKSDRLKLAAWLAGVPVRAGIADGGNNWCYQFSHPYEKYNIGHRTFRYLPMTRWLAGTDAALRFEALGPDRFGGTSIRERLRESGWDGGPYVVLGAFPNQRNPERRWFPGNEPWIRLAALARAAGIAVVLVGGPEHQEALDQMAREAGCLCLAGRTTLPQLMALMAGAAGIVSVDTGLAHVAAATGKPTVVIFGPGLEFWDLPCGPKVIALRGNPAGEPVFPMNPGTMEGALSPWSWSTTGIPAERAWGVLNHLIHE
jgi:ADP-heptose:LPS heptosyltransferase